MKILTEKNKMKEFNLLKKEWMKIQIQFSKMDFDNIWGYTDKEEQEKKFNIICKELNIIEHKLTDLDHQIKYIRTMQFKSIMRDKWRKDIYKAIGTQVYRHTKIIVPFNPEEGEEDGKK